MSGSHLLVALALLGLLVPLSSAWELGKRPWFCHGLDCPKYEVVDTTDAYEVREYSEGVWATTTVESYNYAFAVSVGFRRLFRYIDGDNKDGVKIPMTSPVLTEVEPSCGPFCKNTFNVSFFVPFHLQKSTPLPSSPDVTITCSPAFTAYVAEAGGYKMDEYSLGAMATALADALEADGVEFESDRWFVAGYDPPFRLTNRHTEIWIKAKDGAARTGASMVAEE